MTRPIAALAGVLAAAACGGGAGAAPTPLATPAPVPAATPTPAPVASPAPPACEPPCEAPTTSTTPAARLTIRLYIVTNREGVLQQLAPGAPLPVGYRVTIDATAKDAAGAETLGAGTMRWLIDDGGGAIEFGGNHSHQVKIQAKKPGQATVQAKLDAVKSNILSLRIE